MKDKKSLKDIKNTKDVINYDVNKPQTFPFIEELVDKLYNESLNELIEKNVSTPIDKKVFLMFVMMYFVVHLQLDDEPKKKETIKEMLGDLMSNRDKRKLFISFFNEKFSDFEFAQDVIKRIEFEDN